MPRPPRPNVAGGIYHVTTRGVRKSAIFRGVDDRLEFLRLLARTVEEETWQCLTYCLMTTHFHLLVRTPRPTISRGMWLLNGKYAKYFNEHHALKGHVFEKRFVGDLLEEETHVWTTARYIVLNPVRAGTCASPEDWPWSSYRATIGLEPSPPYLAVDWLLGQLGSGNEGVATFRRFVEEALAADEAA